VVYKYSDFAHLKVFDSQTLKDILIRQGKIIVYAVFFHICLILTLKFLNIVYHFFHIKEYKLEIIFYLEKYLPHKLQRGT